VTTRELLDARDLAFPMVIRADTEIIWHPGMSRREYFAGQALSGLLASEASYPDSRSTAERAVRYSDALLIALASKAPP